MDKRSLAVLGCIAAALTGAVPAAAESVGTPYAVSTSAVRKSDALLGTSSRLAALVAQQSGLTQPSAAPSAIQPAVLRIADKPVVQQSVDISDRPDLFGSVALSVASTPLDRRWSHVSQRSAPSDVTRWAAALRRHSEAERIEAVNRFVNARIAFMDDARQFGRADVWQTAADALQRGRGDCEDYAIAKLHLLRAAGLDERDLFLVVVRDLIRRSDHAVLGVRSGGRLLVLDNGSDRVADSADIRDYRPIFTYSAGQRWTHGYRRTSEPPLAFAAAAPTGNSLPVPAAGPALLETAEPVFTVSAADFAPGLLG